LNQLRPAVRRKRFSSICRCKPATAALGQILVGSVRKESGVAAIKYQSEIK
jgi:hypothetical protein